MVRKCRVAICGCMAFAAFFLLIGFVGEYESNSANTDSCVLKVALCLVAILVAISYGKAKAN